MTFVKSLLCQDFEESTWSVLLCLSLGFLKFQTSDWLRLCLKHKQVQSHFLILRSSEDCPSNSPWWAYISNQLLDWRSPPRCPFSDHYHSTSAWLLKCGEDESIPTSKSFTGERRVLLVLFFKETFLLCILLSRIGELVTYSTWFWRGVAAGRHLARFFMNSVKLLICNFRGNKDGFQCSWTWTRTEIQAVIFSGCSWNTA